VSAIAALSLLLVPGSSIAEPTSPNEVGLYTTPDAYDETGTLLVESPVNIYHSVPGDLRVMYSIADAIHEAPVFLFGGFAIAVETESFGSVKALYR
jgi:hypothetical protein